MAAVELCGYREILDLPLSDNGRSGNRSIHNVDGGTASV